MNLLRNLISNRNKIFVSFVLFMVVLATFYGISPILYAAGPLLIFAISSFGHKKMTPF